MAKKLDFTVEDVKRAIAAYNTKTEKVIDSVVKEINFAIAGTIEKIAAHGTRGFEKNDEGTLIELVSYTLEAEDKRDLGSSYSLEDLVSVINIRILESGFKAEAHGEYTIVVLADLTE